MEIAEALRKMTGTAWNVRGTEIEQAEDGTPRIAAPSMKEIADFIANDPDAYKAKRAKEYPPITDQLDAIFKGGQDFTDMKATVDAVKAKYPKGVAISTVTLDEG